MPCGARLFLASEQSRVEHRKEFNMALERFGQPLAGVDTGIRSIGNVFAQMPRIQAQAALIGSEANKNRAQAGEAAQHGELFRQLGLKTKDEIAAAQEVAAALQNVQKNPDGSVTIPADSIGRISGIIARTGNPNSTGGGIKNIFSTANAPVEANANRENKIDVARVKPIVLSPNQTAISNTESVPGIDPESGDPTATPGIGSVIATAPPAPQQAAKALPDYTTTTVDDIKNPAYDISSGATNVPPMIKKTNVTQRVSGTVKPPVAAQPAPHPQERQKGQVYATPKGNLRWTGTGWVQP